MKNGILLIDKEDGLTSRQVDNALQKRFQEKKVGHLGTLDPFATGLLVVALGKATKYLPFLDDSVKSYLAELRLGVATNTADRTGEVVKEEEPPSFSLEEIRAAFQTFLGDSKQLPPMTSAIKLGGIPLYKLAHEGKEVERKTRDISIYSLNLIAYHDNTIVFTCTVSKGTYVRTLGEDIAKKLGTLGHLTSLRRLSVGPFRLDMAKTLGELTEEDVLDPSLFLRGMKRIEIDSDDEKKVYDGVKFTLLEDYGDRVILQLHGKALAVYEKVEGTTYRSLRGLF